MPSAGHNSGHMATYLKIGFKMNVDAMDEAHETCPKSKNFANNHK